MNSKVYDILKWVSMIALPAANTCAAAIMALCGVDTQVIAMVTGIVAAVNTFLGTILGISSAEYFKNAEANEEVGSDEDIH